MSSGWEFLNETLADSAIVVGFDETTIARSIDAISSEDVENARRLSATRKADYEWLPLAVRTVGLFESVVLAR